MGPSSKLPRAFLAKAPFGEEGDDIWMATTFSFKRNLRPFLFPAKMDAALANQMLPVVKEGALHLQGWQNPMYLAGKELDPLDKEYLFEHFLLVEGFDHLAPEYGFIVDDQGLMLCSINVKDHLNIRVVDFQNRFDEGLKRINEAEKGLSKELETACSPRFGFLTANLGECGTAFFVMAYLHLPALVHTGKLIDAIKKIDEGVLVSSMEGMIDHPPGDLITLTNRYTLGVTPESTAALINQTALLLVNLEREARNELKAKGHIEIKDLIARNTALLLHSYQLETKEALLALSLACLGIDLEMCTGVDKKKVLQAFAKVRRAHLCYQENESDIADVLTNRAKFLHGYLAGLTVK